MQDEWKEKGLSILAVTSEGAADTEKWVANKGVRYPYAYDKAGKLARHFGVRGIPHAVLIDAAGTVVWRGHPGALEEKDIARAVVGALSRPLWEWSGSAKAVKAALQKRAFKSAVDQASKLPAGEGGSEVLAAVQGMVKARLDGLKSVHEKGDFLKAGATAAGLAKELAGLPEAEEVGRIASAIAGDPEAQRVIKGQKKVAKIRSEKYTKRKELQAAIEDLRELSSEYAGTFVATEAQELITQLNDQGKSM